MFKISNFTFYELIKSNPEIQKVRSSLPQNFECVQNLLEIASILETLRGRLGEPIYINSGFRSQEYNKRVNGVPGSFHCLGRAVDIRANDLTRLRRVVLDYCGFFDTKGDPIGKYVHFENDRFEVCIYSSFIHLAFKY